MSLSALLAACGGGNDGAPGTGGNTGGDQPPASQSSTTSSGSIKGFGSIVVNDVNYDDGNATITVDNNTNASRDDLRLGMIVEVQGAVDSNGLRGTANSIVARSFVRGPITSDIDASANRFTVLGVTVGVNEGTVFDGISSLAELARGQQVEVYGHSDNAGNLIATRIERQNETPPSDQVRLTGTVSDATASSFRINDVVVNYNAAAAISIPNGVVTNGMRLRVSGTLPDASASPLTITATDVREISSLSTGREGQRIELEGIITSFRSATDFDVNGERVTVSDTTEVVGTPSEGSTVEVEGVVTGGALAANLVHVHDADDQADVDLRGPIDNVDTAARTFTMFDGRLTVFWNESTEFEEALDGGNLTSGLVVQVEGRIQGNRILAESVELTTQDEQAAVETSGRIANLNAGARTFTVRNGRVTVQWNDDTRFDTIGGANSLAQGQAVQVSGRLQGNVLLASHIEVDAEAGQQPSPGTSPAPEAGTSPSPAPGTTPPPGSAGTGTSPDDAPGPTVAAPDA